MYKIYPMGLLSRHYGIMICDFWLEDSKCYSVRMALVWYPEPGQKPLKVYHIYKKLNISFYNKMVNLQRIMDKEDF